MQDEVAQALKEVRHEQGALVLQSIEARPVFDGAALVDLNAETPNRAKELIENLMVAANGATARFLEAKGVAVAAPRRAGAGPVGRIVEVAARVRRDAPAASPTAAPSSLFLAKRRQADPLRFPDLSLVIVKLHGARRVHRRAARGRTPPGTSASP